MTSTDIVLTNSILWDNTASFFPEIFLTDGSADLTTYSDIEDGWPGEGNINEDPLFVDPVTYDFGLLSGSPCIDAGDPDFPCIPWGGNRLDMGAFEYDQGFYFDGQNFIVKPIPIEMPLKY